MLRDDEASRQAFYQAVLACGWLRGMPPAAKV